MLNKYSSYIILVSFQLIKRSSGISIFLIRYTEWYGFSKTNNLKLNLIWFEDVFKPDIFYRFEHKGMKYKYSYHCHPPLHQTNKPSPEYFD